jgi:hypothetical protein
MRESEEDKLMEEQVEINLANSVFIQHIWSARRIGSKQGSWREDGPPDLEISPKLSMLTLGIYIAQAGSRKKNKNTLRDRYKKLTN